MSDVRTYLSRLKSEENQTLGVIHVYNEIVEIYSCYTLELPWLNNQRNISCIPKGEYKMIKHNSPKFGSCLWIQNVPNRDEILIHKGNYYKDTMGCVLVGNNISDINGDGFRDVINSGTALSDLLSMLPNESKIILS